MSTIPENSILNTIKKLLGIDSSYTEFDLDIITHINTVFSILTQLGVGPDGGFSISGYDEKWNEYLSQNAYDSIEKIKDYFYQVIYTNLDYDYAKKYYEENGDFNNAACSVLKKGRYIGRNLDWKYSDLVDFLVITPKANGRYSSIGIAGGLSELTKDSVESGIKSDIYKVLPFQLQDGINEHGLFACFNVVPCDYGKNSTTAEVEEKEKICCSMIVRYILDRFKSAKQAAEYIRDYCSVYFQEGLHDMDYELHVMIADNSRAYSLEFVNGHNVVVDITESPFMTNFHRYNTTLNSDGTVDTPESGNPVVRNGITEYGSGLERFNIIARSWPTIRSEKDVMDTMAKVLYTRLYETNPNCATPHWLTEYVGGDLKCNSNPDNFVDAENFAGLEYLVRDRFDSSTWQTVHSVVYDLQTKTAKIKVQEEQDIIEKRIITESTNNNLLKDIQTYIYLKVRQYFDPPTSSSVLSSNERLISELEWRINASVDYQ